MAASITPQVVAHPLSDFQKIGYNTYLCTSKSYTPKTPLVLLFAWNAAAAKHIAKYTVAYRKLFPAARIVLIRCYTSDMYQRASKYQELLTPAMDVVREHTKSGGEVLVHSFSNGGGNQVTEMAKAWVKKYAELMPMRALILDSSPGKGAWHRSHAAISASLPRTLFWRLFGSLLVHGLLFVTFIINTATLSSNKMVALCRQMNDPNIFDVRAPRVYLYSKVDEMVGYEEVEEHAQQAREKGWDVKTFRFEESAHAAHVREDEGKYWGAVLEAWKAGPQ